MVDLGDPTLVYVGVSMLCCSIFFIFKATFDEQIQKSLPFNTPKKFLTTVLFLRVIHFILLCLQVNEICISIFIAQLSLCHVIF